MDFDEYQQAANRTDQRPGNEENALVFPLIGLASEVGSLINQYKKRVRDGEAHELFTDRVAEELGDVLWYIANLTEKLDMSLDDVAQLNLRRVAERWPLPGSTTPASLLDDAYPESERLPRRTSVDFIEIEEGGRLRVRLSCNGELIGDPLSDMAWEDDAYRFHDAFHLSYAALLGWSPITRAFFQRQRSSKPKVREVEDSGRAKVVEEAIAVLAFEYARQEQFLDGVEHLDFSFLRTITDMVSGFEVRVRTVSEWEHAILRSFGIWRRLRDEHGGTLHLDLPARSIEFSPLT